MFPLLVFKFLDGVKTSRGRILYNSLQPVPVTNNGVVFFRSSQDKIPPSCLYCCRSVIMRSSLIFVLLVTVVLLFVVFFYKQAPTMPWASATYLTYGKTKDRLSRENTDSKTQSVGRDEREERSQLQQTFAARKNLIILSPGRGGSTFLGSLFDCNPHVMYCYEPLYSVAQQMFKVNLVRGDKEPKNYKETSIKFSDSFLDCDFSDVSNATFSAFSSSDLHRGASKALSKEYLPKISETSLRKACNAYNYTVIKILSSRVPSKTIQTFKELFQKRNRYHVKMVHLVRDPRAVVVSRIKSVKWMKDHLSPGFHKNVQRICDPILRNVRLGLLYPPPWLKNRFKVIRYEDLTLNTLNTTRELYSFAGFDWSASVDEWIRALTKNTKQRGPYSVFRNASAAIDGWKNAPEPLVRAVENICGDLMDFLAYKKLRKQNIDNTVN